MFGGDVGFSNSSYHVLELLNVIDDDSDDGGSASFFNC
jgi:hypothetical protein